MEPTNENDTHKEWNSNVPKEKIEEIFDKLRNKFGFQESNRSNICDQLLSELYSLAERMSPLEALSVLYAKFMAGYHEWCSVSGVGEQLDAASNSPENMIYRLALWKLLWGEAFIFRFTSEFLHFIFKLASDYDEGPLSEEDEEDYLNNVITPLYNYYIVCQGREKNEKDHAKIIGYDDINQLFWCREKIYSITLKDGSRIMDELPSKRYFKLRDVQWNHVFVKTYKEKRTWFHLTVNFSRLWVIHAAAIWYTACFVFFHHGDENEVELASVLVFGGVISTLLVIIGRIGEFLFVPLKNHSSKLTYQLLFLFIVLIVFAPTYYIIMNLTSPSTSLMMEKVQFIISLIVTLGFAIIPSAYLFGSGSKDKAFTANYTRLNNKDRATSIGFWCFTLVCKFVVSYFLSILFKDFIGAILNMIVSDSIIHSLVLVLAIIFMLSGYLLLLFSDTYFWYIVWGMIFSVVNHAFTSFWTPRENVFTMLPKNICTKISASNDTSVNVSAAIWNPIVASMYHEHQLSIDDVKNFAYIKQEDGSWKPPPIFADHNGCEKYFSKISEKAKRRIRFFTKSFSNGIPDPLPIKKTPTFTVLIPHFSEKIFDDDNLLEYLKRYHPCEWKNFSTYKDNKHIWDSLRIQEYLKDDKFGNENHISRERIWASLRTQTLFRTIFGFMNYSEAIKTLWRVQNPDIVNLYADDPKKLEDEIDLIASRKFRFLVSLQKYSHFSEEEKRDVEYLLSIYPDMAIAYLEEVKNGGKTEFFSVLIDGHCEINDGKRVPTYQIKLPGNPILGDGKADNQNHAIIFYRGEYIQVIDANQENYFEECLKISNVLGEFEQYTKPCSEPSRENPIAIVGTREHVFSRNYGVIGDVIAGKGEAFGVLVQRVMAQLSGRLHYGHPDFFDAAFIVTRGGISKAQKGLHLSEDIFAGMTTFNRGGRIKHCNYIQCGKGRDVGLETVLCFTIKTSNGMGEQLLSREYYYYGTQLPLDRLLTFYYAHPAFHVNHVTITLSVLLLIFGLMFVGAMGAVFPICDTSQASCFNIVPIIEWIKWTINFIILKSFVDLLPSYTQDLIEEGFIYVIKRIGKHLISLSPFFEVFNVQMYADSMMKNLSSGGAHYIASYRGFSMERIQFSNLYVRYSEQIYFGIRILMVVVFVSTTIWTPSLIYLLFLAIAFCFSPFIFNPHQFSFPEFVNDYEEFLMWMYSETTDTEKNEQLANGTKKMNRFENASTNSWIECCRAEILDVGGIIRSFVFAVLGMIVFMFIKMNDPVTSGLPNTGSGVIIYMSIITVEPVLTNAIALAGLYLISFCLGPAVNDKFEMITRSWSIINLIGSFEFLWVMESRKLENAVSGIIALSFMQIFLFKLINWYGNRSTTKPFLFKLIEMSVFAKDFILGHLLLFILFILSLIPRINDLHFIMLNWIEPNEKDKEKKNLEKKKKLEKQKICILLLVTLFMIFMGLIFGPIIFAFNSDSVGVYFTYFNVITFLTILTFYASFYMF